MWQDGVHVPVMFYPIGPDDGCAWRPEPRELALSVHGEPDTLRAYLEQEARKMMGDA